MGSRAIGSDLSALPRLCDDLPGIGGRLRAAPDHFVVEEIPLYEPCGSGEHLYLRVRKTGLATQEMVRRMAHLLRRPEADFGVAGLKDKHAVTTQTISITGGTEQEVDRLREIRGLEVLSLSRHGNKLRTGHLFGNRFTIRVAGAGAGAAERVRPILDRLTRRGAPNWFGEQRFGAAGSSARVGECLLRRDWRGACDWMIGLRPDGAAPFGETEAALAAYRAGDWVGAAAALPHGFHDQRRLLDCLVRARGGFQTAVRRLPRSAVRLYLSAFQSEMFNACLARRFPAIDEVWPGDVTVKHDSGGLFLVEDAEREAPRATAFEISPTGPIFGAKMRLPSGRQGDIERDALAEAGLSLDDFGAYGRNIALDGSRRPSRARPRDLEARQDGDDLVLSFALPPGAYATVLLRELARAEPTAQWEAPDPGEAPDATVPTDG